MEEKKLFWGIIIAISVLIVLGVGTVAAILLWPEDLSDFNDAMFIETPEESALKQSLANIQAQQAELLKDLETAKKALDEERKRSSSVSGTTSSAVSTTTEKDWRGFSLDLRNCDSFAGSLESQLDSLDSDLESSIDDYESAIDDLVLVQKDLVDLRIRIDNETDSSKKDSLKDDEDNLEDDEKTEKDNVDDEKSKVRDLLKDVKNKQNELADEKERCTEEPKVRYSLTSSSQCRLAESLAESLEDDSESDRENAEDDKDDRKSDLDEIKDRISKLKTDQTNSTIQVLKDQIQEEIDGLEKVETEYDTRRKDVENYVSDLKDVERKAKSIKSSVQSTCRTFN